MNLIRRNPGTLPSLLDEFFKPDWFGGMEGMNANVPAVNISESETGFELEVAAPGMKKEDFNIEVDNNVMTISNEHTSETSEENKEKNFSRREFFYSSFRRSFNLPETVNTEKIKASYKDGILSVEIPKKEEALPKPKRMIQIG
ncbi:Hsp20/alpha crystallin family protein [Robertkochia marina]|uniref:Hsp20/alpha crystallin family protein n=1 Tax=Robertkochia marina TaxID=1227945 RepID=A0A4S3LX37_9FLAO|nr:Hsp20/alpha crystallin family protein [Robertkochia marina]THD65744.1 Hsp20/alpha crystallin family protein [Robertkochia marina]TRZ46571.1 Hsp20/alpha crystallin family protein [Robertkochia marina]